MVENLTLRSSTGESNDIMTLCSAVLNLKAPYLSYFTPLLFILDSSQADTS